VDRAASLGTEIIMLDAGWYKGTPKRYYTDMNSTWDAISNSLENWEQGEDLDRFPGGLKPLADYLRSKGMQFGIWSEPERVGPESLVAKQHPDWVIYVPNRKWGMLNFGKPLVVDYFCKVLDRYIRELDVRYIR
jgi:alpha-galactosidase